MTTYIYSITYNHLQESIIIVLLLKTFLTVLILSSAMPFNNLIIL